MCVCVCVCVCVIKDHISVISFEFFFALTSKQIIYVQIMSLVAPNLFIPFTKDVEIRSLFLHAVDC